MVSETGLQARARNTCGDPVVPTRGAPIFG